MRPVSQSPAIEKRVSIQGVPNSRQSASSFTEVFTAAVQDSQVAVPSQGHRPGQIERATTLTAPTLPPPPRLNPLAPRRTTVQATQFLPLPPRPGLRSAPLAQPAALADSPAARTQPSIKTYGTMITAAARQFGVDPALSQAVARAESGVSAARDPEVVLNPQAVSPDRSSFGLFQLTNATGREQLRELDPRQTYNPFNASQNIRLGVGYLKDLSQMFAADTTLRKGLSTTAGANAQEVQRLSIAAYNAGPGRVARAQAQALAQGGNPALYQDIAPHLPRETQVYVQRVEQYAAEFRGTGTVSA